MPIFDSAIFDPAIFDSVEYVAGDMAFQTAGFHRIPMVIAASAHNRYPAEGTNRADLATAGVERNSFSADGAPRVSFLAHMEGR